jgi:hypothetical protein
MIFASPAAWQASGFRPQVCIVGSGPAGITLALQLERHKVPCLILEAGGFEYTPESQDAYRGTVVGDSYFDLATARLRYFGGTSGHWGGWSRQLDEIDFLPRPGVPLSGWPIRKADLDPYAAPAREVLNLPPVPDDVPLNAEIGEVFLRISRPRARFGEKYRQHIERSSTIGLLLNASVVDFVPERGRIGSLSVRTAAALHAVSAPFYAVCTGGIENSRLLLAANARHQGGVVPQAGALGRCWMEHPHFGVGDALMVGLRDLRLDGGFRFYAPRPEVLRTRAIGNFGLRMEVGQSRLKAIIRDGLCYAPQVFEDLARKADAGLVCAATLSLAWEQWPAWDNRIELDTSERDAYGMPRLRLHWKKMPSERQTALAAVEMLASHLARSDRGRVRVAPWLASGAAYPENDERAGFHHMGGTRMSAQPETGVVDAQCKVFGVENLYVGGSSTFATGGHANPTYTIVQLALRLGDHLAAKLRPA